MQSNAQTDAKNFDAKKFADEFLLALGTLVEQCRLALETDDQQAEQWHHEMVQRLRREGDRSIRREFKRLKRACKALRKIVKFERRTLLRVKLLVDQPEKDHLYKQLKRLLSTKIETAKEVMQGISEILQQSMARTHKQLQSIARRREIVLIHAALPHHLENRLADVQQHIHAMLKRDPFHGVLDTELTHDREIVRAIVLETLHCGEYATEIGAHENAAKLGFLIHHSEQLKHWSQKAGERVLTARMEDLRDWTALSSEERHKLNQWIQKKDLRAFLQYQKQRGCAHDPEKTAYLHLQVIAHKKGLSRLSETISQDLKDQHVFYRAQARFGIHGERLVEEILKSELRGQAAIKLLLSNELSNIELQMVQQYQMFGTSHVLDLDHTRLEQRLLHCAKEFVTPLRERLTEELVHNFLAAQRSPDELAVISCAVRLAYLTLEDCVANTVVRALVTHFRSEVAPHLSKRIDCEQIMPESVVGNFVTPHLIEAFAQDPVVAEQNLRQRLLQAIPTGSSSQHTNRAETLRNAVQDIRVRSEIQSIIHAHPEASLDSHIQLINTCAENEESVLKEAKTLSKQQFARQVAEELIRARLWKLAQVRGDESATGVLLARDEIAKAVYADSSPFYRQSLAYRELQTFHHSASNAPFNELENFVLSLI